MRSSLACSGGLCIWPVRYRHGKPGRRWRRSRRTKAPTNCGSLPRVPDDVTDPRRVAGPARRAGHTRVDRVGHARAEFVTLGEALAVFIADPPTPLAAASRFQCTVAGAESNVAVGLARLGHRAVFLGKVGADALGEMVLRRLRAEDFDVSFVRRDPAKPTGLIIRDSSSVRPSEFAYYRRDSAGAALEPADIPDEVVAGCQHLHVSGITA